MPLIRIISTLTICSGLLIAMPSFAADEEDNPAVEYRHEVMETLGTNVAALVKVLTNKVDEPGHLPILADSLSHLAKLIVDLFPDGSQGGHALPLIWEEPDQVTEAANATAEATAALFTAAQSGDRAATMKAFRGVGESCKGCHERYKAEDNHEH
jgi:cytochrome c556